MSIRAVGLRLAIFFGVLILTLLPGPIGMAIPTEATIVRWFAGYAWMWQLMATLPVGIARIPFDGQIWFANTSELVAVMFWLLVGAATALVLQRLRPIAFAAAALVVVLGSGLGAHLLLDAFGYAMFVRP